MDSNVWFVMVVVFAFRRILFAVWVLKDVNGKRVSRVKFRYAYFSIISHNSAIIVVFGNNNYVNYYIIRMLVLYS